MFCNVTIFTEPPVKRFAYNFIYVRISNLNAIIREIGYYKIDWFFNFFSFNSNNIKLKFLNLKNIITIIFLFLHTLAMLII